MAGRAARSHDWTTSQDERLLRLALALGRRNLGRTWPNPSVGAVVVREDGDGPVIVAEGVTAPGGRPHAEPLALAAAGEAARGATLYVSLEPCSHQGRTPPCVDEIVRAGIRRVVTAMEDPDPRVAGRGHANLREAGIAVTAGLLPDEARRAHRGHVARVTRGRPWVTLKLARTADGYAARRQGPRLLVTAEAANRRVHMLRAHADAILVGSGTALGDDPLLTVRLPGLAHRSPVRIVIDASLSLSPALRLVGTAREVPTWIVAKAGAPAQAEERLAGAGAKVLRLPGAGARVDAGDVLRLLAERGITAVLVEGGPRLAEALGGAGFVDELVLLTSSVALGAEGVPALGPALESAMAGNLRRTGFETVGPDTIEWFEAV